MIKRNILIVLMTMIATCCFGCGAKQKDEDVKEFTYEETLVKLSDIHGEVCALTQKDDKVFLCASSIDCSHEEEHEDGEHEEELNLYCLDIDGSIIKKMSLEWGTLTEIKQLFVAENGTITLFMEEFDEKEQVEKNVIALLDENGNVVKKESLADLIPNSGDKEFIDAKMDNQGMLAIESESAVYVLDENLKYIGKVKIDAEILGMSNLKDGEILIAAGGGTIIGRDKISVSKINVNTMKSEKIASVQMGGMSVVSPMIEGNEYDFYYKNDTAVYGYNLKEKREQKVMDFAASFLTPDMTENMVALSGGRFLNVQSGTSEDELVMLIYEKADPATLENRITITYGGLFISDEIKREALNFNRMHKEYQIVFKDYSEEGKDCIEKMNLDMIAGNVPDIIDLSSSPIRQYANKGILEDLAPYIDRDTELNREDYIENVWDSMLIDDKLYYVTTGFGIDTVVGKKSAFGNRGGMTMHEFATETKRLGNGSLAFGKKSKEELLRLFLRSGVGDYVDWDTGNCTLEGEDFKELLIYCNENGMKNGDEDSDAQLEYNQVKEGKQLLVEAVSLSMDTINMYSSMFGEDITFIGYPGKEGAESSFRFQNQIGISSKSKVKDVSWEFVRTFMTKEYQGKNNKMSAPTRKDCFEMLLKAMTTTSSYTDELGQLVMPVEGYWELNGVGIEARPLTNDEALMYKELVNNTKRCADSDSTVRDIIVEEANMYFNDKKSLEETVKIIQNRVQTYVDENQ